TDRVEVRRGPYVRHLQCEPNGTLSRQRIEKIAATWPVPANIADLLAWASLGVANILAAEEFAREVAPEFKVLSWEAVDAKRFWEELKPLAKDDLWAPNNRVAAWGDQAVAVKVLQCEPAADIEAHRHRIRARYLPWINPLRDLVARGVMFQWSRWGRPVLQFPR
ncbi:MAG: hypothetical protein EBY17_31185, partial [Acidobacteriia bacterium]|nr:hypothetical protein [Terriglobia bacterium]